MSSDRSELHALLDRIPETDLPITRKLLQALAVVWDVAPAEEEGEFTDQAVRDVHSAEVFLDRGGQGIPHEEVLKEFGLALCLTSCGSLAPASHFGAPKGPGREKY